MGQVLSIQNLCKQYPSFQLQGVSFAVEKGMIMGFIGRNGAGKTTTLKSIMNLVHPDSGEIRFFGMELGEKEQEIKQRIGYATGGISYYHRKRIRDIIQVTKMFYPNWDEMACRHYLEVFSLEPGKRLTELSEGMKVKFNLTLALSHHAEFLILDEPTSGLDPVSREELLEIFLDLAAQEVSILFSTHITSDLEKCADTITYIQKGQIIASQQAGDFVERYRLAAVSGELSPAQKELALGVRRSKEGQTALILKEQENIFRDLLSGKCGVRSMPESAEALQIMPADLESIMVHLEGGSL